MSLLEKLIERTPEHARLPREVKEAFGYRGRVAASSEFYRINQIPRRDLDSYMDWSAVSEILHSYLKKENGQQNLWPLQVKALYEIVLYGGAFLPLGVGRGKTLISLLAPVVLQSKRPILFVPADLREKTNAVSIPQLQNHWHLHPHLRVIGYSELSLAKNATMLENLQPDLIVLDECHSVGNPKAGRTRRLLRYLSDRPETIVVPMSGTITSKSLRNFAHIAQWALRKNCPLPSDWRTLVEWADALDADVPDETRIHPGALLTWSEPADDLLQTARSGFRKRLVETPAVVASHADELGTSLVIKPAAAPQLKKETWRLISSVRDTWTTPDGNDISEAIDLWRRLRELALGFWYRWDPEPPSDWLDARREWKRNVREAIQHQRAQPVDTELQWWNRCARAADAGQLPAGHPWHAWRALKGDFHINTVAEWVDEGALSRCADWLADNDGICWTMHREFGPRLASLAQVPYYGAGDDSILRSEARSIAASATAHGQGKDLQRWATNLMVAPSASGKHWEQVLGRTHRHGQLADTVTVEVFLHVPELADSFVKARVAARYIEDTSGNAQKLNYADVLISEENEKMRKNQKVA